MWITVTPVASLQAYTRAMMFLKVGNDMFILHFSISSVDVSFQCEGQAN